jgi:diaminopimelate epimerase
MKLADITEIELQDDQFGPSGLFFTKLHGNGNDFILIDEYFGELVPESFKSAFAIRYCHRNLGIGGDGVLFLIRSSFTELGMRLFQPDGSEAEMCGNGIRCLAKYAWEMGYVDRDFDVDTLAGVIPIQVRMGENGFWAKADMGVSRFDRAAIPAIGSGEFLLEKIDDFEVSAVNTGVPHAVIFLDDLDLPINEIAPIIRNHAIFPEGANVNFVKTGDSFEVRTFERGVEAETLCCGTGAVASAAVARKLGLAGDEVFVQTRGGPLIVSFEGERAYMDGPATTVYRGEVSDEYGWAISQKL